MKRILFVLFISLCNTLTYSQDTVFVKGYYIVRYIKDEIVFKIQNEKLRQIGKPFYWGTDLTHDPFFFSLNINSRQLMEEDEIEPILCLRHDFKNIELYQFAPFDQFADLHKSVETILKEMKIMPDTIHFGMNDIFYECKADSVFLYKTYYIEGNALRLEIKNDYLQPKRSISFAMNLGIAPTMINRNISSFYTYYFYNCIILDPFKPPSGFLRVSPRFGVANKKRMPFGEASRFVIAKSQPPDWQRIAKRVKKKRFQSDDRSRFCQQQKWLSLFHSDHKTKSMSSSLFFVTAKSLFPFRNTRTDLRSARTAVRNRRTAFRNGRSDLRRVHLPLGGIIDG